jgi:hypothetical protein
LRQLLTRGRSSGVRRRWSELYPLTSTYFPYTMDMQCSRDNLHMKNPIKTQNIPKNLPVTSEKKSHRL